MLEENEDMFVRLDFQGITKESVKILIEPTKKAVFVFGEAPKEFKQDSSHKKYGTVTGLVCDCFGGAKMPTSSPDHFDPTLTGRVILPHPSVLEGPASAYEAKHLPNGGLYLRIDMPGVPNDKFTVAVEDDGGLTVMGRASPVLYDSSTGREYGANGGRVAILHRDYGKSRIKIIAKHGVIRLIIPSR
ncbi:unnamed protein product [Cochlearia groenlandica]